MSYLNSGLQHCFADLSLYSSDPLCPYRQFTLVRVVNVVKRVDGIQGNRYLLELELKDANGQLLRLSQYIYTLNHYSRQHNKDFRVQQSKPELMLCNPVGFRWNPVATVHFIVPGTIHPHVTKLILFTQLFLCCPFSVLLFVWLLLFCLLLLAKTFIIIIIS